MKARNYERNLVKRRWSNHSGVCDYHLGGCWLCGIAADHPKKRRSKNYVARSNQVSIDRSELGSVTAEFAIILPTALLILVISISVLAIQTNRMALIELAAEGSRAVARGESQTMLNTLIQDRKLSPLPQVNWVYEELSICLELVENIKIPLFGNFLAIPVLERQCARKSGL
jgi:hypothetical protein